LSRLKVALAQQEFVVGDIPGNTDKIISTARQALADDASLVIFPELTLTGYPPEDLLLRDSLETRIQIALDHICDQQLPLYLVVGYPSLDSGLLTNCAAVIYRGDIICEYNKQHLPNYQVFDEKRYFTPGEETVVVDIEGFKCALSICEDIWFDEPVAMAKQLGAEVILNINGSPFHINRDAERRARVTEVAETHELAICYVNHICGQDELVFDGGSMAADSTGLKHHSSAYQESLDYIYLNKSEQGVQIEQGDILAPRPMLEDVYQALILGLKAYVNRNGFNGVVLGLSGGIDSGFSLAVAVDALGADRVQAIMMPYAYTSKMSLDDAREQAKTLGIEYSELPIGSLYDAGIETLNPLFEGLAVDTTEQNLQARIRGLLLMAVSNKSGKMVLTTGNKSELAVGYATLYGDMCGGYNVLKDVPKTLVFQLAEYRNKISPVIPQRVIDRPPSAELAPDQKDEDSLPSYEVLDAIIEAYVEQDKSAEAIVSMGFNSEEVYRVVRLIDINEYKRRQAPEGVRITPRGFGRDRRYPITNGWKPGI